MKTDSLLAAVLFAIIAPLALLGLSSRANATEPESQTTDMPPSPKIAASSLMQPEAQIPFHPPEELTGAAADLADRMKNDETFVDEYFGAIANWGAISVDCVPFLTAYEIPFPRNFEQLIEDGWWPFLPPNDVVRKVDELGAFYGWGGLQHQGWNEGGSGVIDRASNWNWYISLSEADKMLYLRQHILLDICDQRQMPCLLELPGYAYPEERNESEEHYFSFIGPYNPAFWTNPYTGELMHRILGDEPEAEWWGNFIANGKTVRLIYHGNPWLDYGEGEGLSEITPELRELVRKQYQ